MVLAIRVWSRRIGPHLGRTECDAGSPPHSSRAVRGGRSPRAQGRVEATRGVRRPGPSVAEFSAQSELSEDGVRDPECVDHDRSIGEPNHLDVEVDHSGEALHQLFAAGRSSCAFRICRASVMRSKARHRWPAECMPGEGGYAGRGLVVKNGLCDDAQKPGWISGLGSLSSGIRESPHHRGNHRAG